MKVNDEKKTDLSLTVELEVADKISFQLLRTSLQRGMNILDILRVEEGKPALVHEMLLGIKTNFRKKLQKFDLTIFDSESISVCSIYYLT